MLPRAARSALERRHDSPVSVALLQKPQHLPSVECFLCSAIIEYAEKILNSWLKLYPWLRFTANDVEMGVTYAETKGRKTAWQTESNTTSGRVPWRDTSHTETRVHLEICEELAPAIRPRDVRSQRIQNDTIQGMIALTEAANTLVRGKRSGETISPGSVMATV